MPVAYYSSYVLVRMWVRCFLLVIVIALNVYKLHTFHTHLAKAKEEDIQHWNTHVIWPLYGAMLIVSCYWLATVYDLHMYYSQRRQTSLMPTTAVVV